MTHDQIHEGTRRTRLQNESAEYLAKREELRVAEIEVDEAARASCETAP